jgi:N-methylhydantoinase B
MLKAEPRPGSEDESADPELWTIGTDDPRIDELDPFTYEVVRHRLGQVNEEQAAALRKATGSVVVDAGDFNVALATADGEVAYDGNYALFHAAATEMLFKRLLEWAPDAVGLNDGDMFFTNHPFMGALHQNDGVLATPIFWEGKLICWSAAVLHAMDVGGTAAGSFCVEARNRWDDPVRIPPIKIVERGTSRSDFEDLYFGMSRLPALAALDLRAQLSAGNVARARIRDVIEVYGPQTVTTVLRRVLRDSERALRQRLRELPDGTWRAVQHIDKAGIGDRGIHKVSLALTKLGDGLIFDLRGSDPEAGVIGAPLNVSRAALVVPVLQYLCAGLQRSSSAVLRVCEFVTEAGTLPDVSEEASVSCASATGTYTQIAISHQCISRMLSSHPELRRYLSAPSYTSPFVFMLSGVDQNGQPFVTMLMDPTFAAIGARSYADGVDTGGISYVTQGRAPDVETNELHYPILYTHRREATDSGGPGRFRGGACMEMGIVPHRGGETMALMTLGFGAAFPDNYGLFGGYPSSATEFAIVRDAGVRNAFERGELPVEPQSEPQAIDFKGNDAMGADDLFLGRSSASAGWGDPLEREPEAVVRDVSQRLVSEHAAAEVYGVILASGALDPVATDTKRAQILAHRLSLPLAVDLVDLAGG